MANLKMQNGGNRLGCGLSFEAEWIRDLATRRVLLVGVAYLYRQNGVN